jgi:hypothetical protein
LPVPLILAVAEVVDEQLVKYLLLEQLLVVQV